MINIFMSGVLRGINGFKPVESATIWPNVGRNRVASAWIAFSSGRKFILRLSFLFTLIFLSISFAQAQSSAGINDYIKLTYEGNKPLPIVDNLSLKTCNSAKLFTVKAQGKNGWELDYDQTDPSSKAIDLDVISYTTPTPENSIISPNSFTMKHDSQNKEGLKVTVSLKKGTEQKQVFFHIYLHYRATYPTPTFRIDDKLAGWNKICPGQTHKLYMSFGTVEEMEFARYEFSKIGNVNDGFEFYNLNDPYAQDNAEENVCYWVVDDNVPKANIFKLAYGIQSRIDGCSNEPEGILSYYPLVFGKENSISGPTEPLVDPASISVSSQVNYSNIDNQTGVNGVWKFKPHEDNPLAFSPIVTSPEPITYDEQELTTTQNITVDNWQGKSHVKAIVELEVTGPCGANIVKSDDITIYKSLPDLKIDESILPPQTAGQKTCLSEDGLKLDLTLLDGSQPILTDDVEFLWEATPNDVVSFDDATSKTPTINLIRDGQVTLSCSYFYSGMDAHPTAKAIPASTFEFLAQLKSVTLAATDATQTTDGKHLFCKADGILSTSVLPATNTGTIVYSWEKDAVIAGETAATLTVDETHVYKVNATNGCSTVSDEIDVIITGLVEPVISIPGGTTQCNSKVFDASVTGVDDRTAYTITWLPDAGAAASPSDAYDTKITLTNFDTELNVAAKLKHKQVATCVFDAAPVTIKALQQPSLAALTPEERISCKAPHALDLNSKITPAALTNGSWTIGAAGQSTTPGDHVITASAEGVYNVSYSLARTEDSECKSEGNFEWLVLSEAEFEVTFDKDQWCQEASGILAISVALDMKNNDLANAFGANFSASYAVGLGAPIDLTVKNIDGTKVIFNEVSYAGMQNAQPGNLTFKFSAKAGNSCEFASTTKSIEVNKKIAAIEIVAENSPELLPSHSGGKNYNCQGDGLQLTANPKYEDNTAISVATYSWSVSAPLTLEGATTNTVKIPDDAYQNGELVYTVQVTAQACVSQSSYTLETLEKPSVALDGYPENSTIEQCGGVKKYTLASALKSGWMLDDPSYNSTDNTITFTQTAQEDLYDLKLTVSQSKHPACKGEYSAKVKVYAVPSLVVDLDAEFCAPGYQPSIEVKLNELAPTDGIYSYKLESGGNEFNYTDLGDVKNHAYDAPAEYKLTVGYAKTFVSGETCAAAEVEKSLKVHKAPEKPIVEVGRNGVFCDATGVEVKVTNAVASPYVYDLKRSPDNQFISYVESAMPPAGGELAFPKKINAEFITDAGSDQFYVTVNVKGIYGGKGCSEAKSDLFTVKKQGSIEGETKLLMRPSYFCADEDQRDPNDKNEKNMGFLKFADIKDGDKDFASYEFSWFRISDPVAQLTTPVSATQDAPPRLKFNNKNEDGAQPLPTAVGKYFYQLKYRLKQSEETCWQPVEFTEGPEFELNMVTPITDNRIIALPQEKLTTINLTPGAAPQDQRVIFCAGTPINELEIIGSDLQAKDYKGHTLPPMSVGNSDDYHGDWYIEGVVDAIVTDKLDLQNNISAGALFYRKISSGGCISKSDRVQFVQNKKLVATVVETAPSCDVATNGNIVITVDSDPAKQGNSGFTGAELQYSGELVAPDGTVKYQLTSAPYEKKLETLGNGEHKITLQDRYGCPAEIDGADEHTVTFASPALELIELKPVAVKCPTEATGEINVTWQGGVLQEATSQYNIQLFDNQNVQLEQKFKNNDPKTVNFNGLKAGAYKVKLRLDGCPSEPEGDVFISEPMPLELDAIEVTPANGCGEQGKIFVIAKGGSAPYKYGTSLSASAPPASYQPGSQLKGLAQGTYYVYVEDDLGCQMPITPAGISVDQVGKPSAKIAVSDGTCQNQSRLKMTVLEPGALPASVQIISGSELMASFDATITEQTIEMIGLPAGEQYKIKITDATGCSADEINFKLKSDTKIQPSVSNIIPDSRCNPDEDPKGGATISASGAAKFALWHIDRDGIKKSHSNGDFSEPLTLTALEAGNYTIELTGQEPGCVATTSFSIASVKQHELKLLEYLSATSAAPNSGKVSALLQRVDGVPLKVKPTYSIEPNDGTMSISAETPYLASFSGLSSKAYKITATIDGCSYSQSTQPMEFQVYTSVTNAACAPNDNNGSIRIATAGQLGRVDVEWYKINGGTPEQITGANISGDKMTLSNLEGGEYRAVVKDLGNTPPTSVEISPIIVKKYVKPTIRVVGVAPVCQGTASGIIGLYVEAPGTADKRKFKYSLSGKFTDVSEKSAVAYGMAPGSYSVKVEDAAGCISNFTGQVPEATPVEVVVKVSEYHCDEDYVKAQFQYTEALSPVALTVNYSLPDYQGNTVNGSIAQDAATLAWDQFSPQEQSVKAGETVEMKLSYAVKLAGTSYSCSNDKTDLLMPCFSHEGKIFCHGEKAKDFKLIAPSNAKNASLKRVKDAEGNVVDQNVELDPDSFQPTEELTAGEYEFTVTINGQPQLPFSFTLVEPEAIKINGDFTPYQCFQGGDQRYVGKLENFFVTKGTPYDTPPPAHYKYLFGEKDKQPEPDDFTKTVANTPPPPTDVIEVQYDNPVIYVIDANNCLENWDLSAGTAIPQPIVMESGFPQVYPVRCQGEADGMIIARVAQDNIRYILQKESEPGSGDWIVHQTKGDGAFDQLEKGVYRLRMVDNSDCEDFYDNIKIEEPPSIDITINPDPKAKPLKCPGDFISFLSATITGRQTENILDYSWHYESANGETDTISTQAAIIREAKAGEYVLQVIDDQGCVAESDVYTVVGPVPFSWSKPPLVIPAECKDYDSQGVSTGSVTLFEVKGGKNPVAVWDETPIAADIGQPISTTKVYALRSGDWKVKVTDDNGCEDRLPVKVGYKKGNSVDFSITHDKNNQFLCYGENLTGIKVNYDPATKGLVDPAIPILWKIVHEPDYKPVVGALIEDEETPETWRSAVGIHGSALLSATVQSTKGCRSTETLNVSTRPSFNLAFDDVRSHVGIFFKSKVEDVKRSGVDPEGNEVKVMKDSIVVGALAEVPAEIAVSSILTELGATDMKYELTPTMLFEETQDPSVFTMTLPKGVLLLDDLNQNGYVVTATHGRKDLTLLKTQISLTDPNTSCTETIDLYVRLIDKLRIPNVFTPNGDGVNDRWLSNTDPVYTTIFSDLKEFLPDLEVEVFTRSGIRVWQAKGEKVGEGWDGTQRGKGNAPLPMGTYYYVIKFNIEGADKSWKPIAGSVTIVR